MSSGNMTHPRSQISLLQNHDLMISWPPVFQKKREKLLENGGFQQYYGED